MILTPSDAKDPNEKYVILTTQARIAASSLAFLEIPAGMCDSSGDFTGVAAKEIEEETGLKINQAKLLDLSAAALVYDPKNPKVDKEDVEGGEGLRKALFPSPGACDESITLYLYREKMERGKIDDLKDILTGVREEGEKIKLKLVPLQNLWWEGARDGKTLAALALYENLKRVGKLPEEED